MAEDVAEDEQEGRGTSPIMAVVFVLVAALVAGGSGFAAGKMLFAPMVAAGDGASAEAAAPAPEPVAQSEDAASGDGEQAGAADARPRGLDYRALQVVALDPITTNIGVPADVWVRMELSLAVERGEDGEAPDPVMLEAVQADFLAYMRTTRLQSLSMPSGFQHLVTDLESRAALRSGGAVRRVFVKALLLE